MRVAAIPTPALLVDAGALDRNIATMAAALPGARLRPHVKAHKCTGLAQRQAAAGHRQFTCATIRECEGMAAAGWAVAPGQRFRIAAPPGVRISSARLEQADAVSFAADFARALRHHPSRLD